MRVHNRRWIATAACLVLGSFCLSALGQTGPSAPGQTSADSSASAQLHSGKDKAKTSPASSNSALPNYTQRETQPNLGVDRDPVTSPDMSENLPWGSQAAGVAITKSKKSNIYTLNENVDEVVLNCTVLNRKGQLVKGLKAGDFRVWEDGVPQKITAFQYGDVPVSLGILIDNSASMRDKRAAVNRAALALVRASNPKDRTFVVNFNENAYLDQGLTSNVGKLREALAHYQSHGTTAIYDAVYASANELAGHAKWPKQVLLIITDGADDASRLTLQEAAHRVERMGGPVVYSIGLLFDPESKQEAKKAKTALEDLSSETGGVAFFPSSLQDVQKVALEIAYDIRNQYIIGYHSTKSPSLGGYRTVRVAARGRGRRQLIVRTRKGYYPRQINQMHSVQTAKSTK